MRAAPGSPAVVGRLDQGFADARDPKTIGQQGQQTNQWKIHPLIDGCGVYLAIPPPGGGTPKPPDIH